MIGQSISHYRVVDRIGQGGMGIVYRAVDTRLGRPVALKFLPADLTGNVEARARFEREAQAVSALDHPNICTVYEIDDAEDGRAFIAMACYDGDTLDQRIAEKPLPLNEIVDIALQVAAGLAEAHAKGVIHRDLKPANILITEAGIVKIVDFGLARLIGQSGITRSDAAPGTVAYMAPEQLQGNPVDQRADLWSLGVVLYEMATGERPFTGDYPEAVMYQIVNGEPAVLDVVPAPLRPIILRCLQKDPADRLQSAQEVQDALAAIANASDSAPISRRRTARIAVASALVAGIILISLAVDRLPTQALTNWFTPAPELVTRHIAVLPFRVVGGSEESEAYSRGLMETLTSRLTQLDRYSDTPYWVVPASEVLAQNVSTAREARRMLDVNLAVEGSLQLDDGHARMSINLVDTRSLRQIATWVSPFVELTAASFQDEVVVQVSRMMGLSLPEDAVGVINAGGSTDLEANHYYNLGRGYLQRFDDAGQVESAITLFRRATQEDPEFLLAYAGLAEAYLRRFEATQDIASLDSAIAYGRRVEQQGSVPAQVYVSLGVVYGGTGQDSLALETFDKALRLDPDDVEAHRGRGRALAAAGRPLEAESAYWEAIRLRPEYWAGYFDLGVLYYRSGRFDEAIRKFEQVIDRTPDHSRALSNLGGALFQVGRYDEAQYAFERSLGVEPTYRAYANLATLYYDGGRFDAAIDAYREALALNDRDHRLWGFLGSAYFFTEQQDSARVAFLEAIERAEPHRRTDPVETALFQSGYAAALGDRARSLAYLQEVLDADPDPDAQRSFAIAEVYEVIGDRDEALSWMERALDNGLALEDVAPNRRFADLIKDPRYQAMKKRFAS